MNGQTLPVAYASALEHQVVEVERRLTGHRLLELIASDSNLLIAASPEDRMSRCINGEETSVVHSQTVGRVLLYGGKPLLWCLAKY